MIPTPTSDPIQPNAFLTVLQRKETQDSLLTELSRRLCDTALAVKKTGKKATLSLTLTIEPEKGGALSVGALIAGKIPSTQQESLTIFYVDQEGGLHRNNPEQKELPLRVQDGGAQPDAEQTRATAASAS